MKKSVIVPDFEKKDAIPPYKESMNALKLKRKVGAADISMRNTAVRKCCGWKATQL